jgi:hypothetical protein
MVQIPNFKENCFGHLKLEFGAYLGFEICNLEFKTDHFDILLSFWSSELVPFQFQ